MPSATFRDRMSFHLGGKEIQLLHLGFAHTKGDTVLFVPQDRIVYMSEVFFNEEFPNMGGGYGVSWIRVLDAVKALDADIFIPGHGPIPDDPKQTRAALERARQILVDARDGIQNEIARGATEDQAVAASPAADEKLPSFGTKGSCSTTIYKELKGRCHEAPVLCTLLTVALCRCGHRWQQPDAGGMPRRRPAVELRAPRQ